MVFLLLKLIAIKGMSIKESQFFVVVHGKPLGPFSFQEIEKMHLKPSDFLKTTDSKDFKELREIPELCEFIAIPYQPSFPQYFATMDMRLLAWAIDFLISFVLFCLFIFVPILFFALPENRMQFTLIGLLSVFPIHFFMNVFMESSEQQGSFGKKLLKIKVCDTKGFRISLGRSFLRNVLNIRVFKSWAWVFYGVL